MALGLKAARQTCSRGERTVGLFRPAFRLPLQTRAVRSSLDVTIKFPSGLKSRLYSCLVPPWQAVSAICC